MANDAITYYEPGATITGHATAAVTGKRFVNISGNRVGGNIAVAPAAAGANVFGVAGWDAAAGEKVTVIRENAVVPVTAAAAIAAGASVTSDATGQAVTATGAAGAVVHAVGRAVADAAVGADCLVALQRHSFTA